jgi:hypothetical protein
MCTTPSGTLTLEGMLNDPLIQAVRQSYGVSKREYETMLYRVKDTLAERSWPSEQSREQLEDA